MQRDAWRLLGVNRERYVKSAAEMAALFADLPAALDHAWELSQTLEDPAVIATFLTITSLIA